MYACIEQDGYSASFNRIELLKSSLIDLEALWGDKAQVAVATAWTTEWEEPDRVCDSLNTMET